MRILGKNVNIMDDAAQVIGSGDPSRIGEYHYAAAVAIAENRTVEVDKDNMEELRCKRTGINVPVVLGDDIVGVVGMTGEPDEVRGYGELLKEFVELMLQQSSADGGIPAETGGLRPLRGGSHCREPGRGRKHLSGQSRSPWFSLRHSTGGGGDQSTSRETVRVIPLSGNSAQVGRNWKPKSFAITSWSWCGPILPPVSRIC
jgi:hypothetical protein